MWSSHGHRQQASTSSVASPPHHDVDNRKKTGNREGADEGFLPRRFSVDEDDEEPRPQRGEDGDGDSHNGGGGGDEDDEKKPVAWRSLPRKSQLAILTVARLSEPLAQTSLQAYMFYQLKSFDPSLPDATVSKQTGVLQASFTGAQFATAVLWGRLADTEMFGRKRVLLIGLLGTTITSIAFGFSKSFAAAAVFRTLGGAVNSNVGVMRTMIAEIIEKKRYAHPFYTQYWAPPLTIY